MLWLPNTERPPCEQYVVELVAHQQSSLPLLSAMPLNRNPKLPWPRGLDRERNLGTHPNNLLDVLSYMVKPGKRGLQAPHQLSVEQKAAAFDLLMYYYQRSRDGESLNDIQNRFVDILSNKEVRQNHALFSDAILDGAIALKERVEDRLICTIEVDFDKVNKQRPGQTHVDLIPAITWRLPQLLRDNLQVEKTFMIMEKGLSKAIVCLTNELPIRRNYGPELLRKVRLLTQLASNSYSYILSVNYTGWTPMSKTAIMMMAR